MSLRERLRLWLMFNEGYRDFAVLAVAGSVMSGLLLAALAPTGPQRKEPGTLVRHAGLDSKYGYRPRAEVRLASGLTVDIPMPRVHRCRVGDTVVVEFSPRLWGVLALPERKGCAV